MTVKRVPLYDRLPAIYRIKDAEQTPPYQLRSYLELVEGAFGAIHENIEALYDDLFIETSADWVIPYIGDLLGTSHLSGDPWTLRADVADTIALRRRKGTLASIERLTYNLTQWGVHCVELRENLVWNQHLNHQRPDVGGQPPYAEPGVTRFTPIRGGTVTLRDPAILSLLNTPFDPFAHVVDVKPAAFGQLRYNLPNLAIFLWRLEAYMAQVSKPSYVGRSDDGTTFWVRFNVHPMGEPVRLFNSHQFDPDLDPPVVTQVDQTPSPITVARLDEKNPSGAGNPEFYVAVETYDPNSFSLESLDIQDVGLQLHIPTTEFGVNEIWPSSSNVWTMRGGNLCAWESGIQPGIKNREIVIDPVIGRVVFGVGSKAEADALEADLLITYTYGSVGPVGAHPISHNFTVPTGNGVVEKTVNYHTDPDGLKDTLGNLPEKSVDIVINDSMTHTLNINDVLGVKFEDIGENLLVSHTLTIRAADGQRPIIMLKNPLRFRPKNASEGNRAIVKLEGIYLTRDKTFPADKPLIARAALNRLELVNCILDPGGYVELGLNETRAPLHKAMILKEPYGFDNIADEKAFDQTPEIVLNRTIAGSLQIDEGYRLYLTNSILDAGKGVGDDPGTAFAVSSATEATDKGWGPPTQVNGLTVFGRMRVESIHGQGGIWVHALEVHNNQKGCLKLSYFSGVNDRLPQNMGCVNGTDVKLHFIDESFGSPAYAQLAFSSDFKIRERGPKDNQIGAFGFLYEAHKWRNIQIRFREFMPVGVRPLLIPVT